MDWNALITGAAIATLFASVVSPTITTAIANSHERKMWQIKVADQRRANAIAGYVEAVSVLAYSPTSNARVDYESKRAELQLYTGLSSADAVSVIDSALEMGHLDSLPVVLRKIDWATMQIQR